MSIMSYNGAAIIGAWPQPPSRRTRPATPYPGPPRDL